MVSSLQALIDLHKDLLRLTAPTTSSSSLTPQPATSPRQRVDGFYADEMTESHLVDMVLKLLMDDISEVKNSAVSW